MKSICAVIAALAGFIASNAGASAHYAVIDEFVDGATSSHSYGPLIADSVGNLYGTASTGGNGGCVKYGSTGCGTVFELSPPASPGGAWQETVLYKFPGGNGPWEPIAGLSMDSAGDLFGTTDDGDVYGCVTTHCGTVFELKPPAMTGGAWSYATLYRFTQGNDGFNTASGVILDRAGNVYGTTLTSGPYNRGTVFRLSRANPGSWWKLTVLSGFETGGNFPIGNVAFDTAGNLYGTTYYGGPSDLGIIYQLVPTQRGHWTENPLYPFGQNACYPKTNVIFDAVGNLYGTAQGCPQLSGALWKLAPPKRRGGHWTESIVRVFPGTSNYDPTISIVFNRAGDIFGTTASGGTYGFGTVFELKPPAWTETVLHSFAYAGGEFPTSGPVFGTDGALYGTTLFGGNRQGVCKIGGCGVVYRLSP